MMDIRDKVRRRYGSIATNGVSCCGPASSAETCCSASTTADPLQQNPEDTIGLAHGYSPEELKQVPDGANLGLGCGNPTAIASLNPGETVLDLGSGAGFDCFLAAARVGDTGRVIGVDMTPAMIERARANADRGGFSNVEFLQGYIEELPLPDGSVDVVISNCVINLSVDKPQVFREIARVLKPGGRMYVSDIVLTRKLPWIIRRSTALYSACIAGAITRTEYLSAIEEAGLNTPEIVSENVYSIDLFLSDPNTAKLARLSRVFPPLRNWAESVHSISVRS